MVFEYDPMDIDNLSHGESEFVNDEMDFIHEPATKSFDSNVTAISSSFFQHPYNKSGEIANKFSTMFRKITLDEAEEEESEKDTTNERQLVLLEDSLSSATSSNIEPSTAEAPVVSASLPNSPVSQISSNKGHEASSPALAYHRAEHPNHHYNYNPHYNPHYNPTFVYHEAQPIDTSHRHIVYAFGLFKIICYSIVFSCCLYIGYQVAANVRNDMRARMASYESDFLGNQLYCQEQYHVNRCGPDTALPAVQTLCRSWEQCMMRPFAVGKTKVLAEVLGEAANEFSELLTLRTMFYSICISIAFFWSFTHLLNAHLHNGQQQQQPKQQQHKAITTATSARYPLLNKE
ncbi:hypothetical protein [Parasitella parasitica]|uniref:Brl1/Brr6 domain-containing protein n=1 Tax=Parasitella parasitica TaxID=35722 RepID=A0A0B7N861_9FUNG|nr:hypothetical protein [Parasitella parasitica]